MDPETHTEDYIHTYWSSGVYPLNARLFNNQKKKKSMQNTTIMPKKDKNGMTISINGENH